LTECQERDKVLRAMTLREKVLTIWSLFSFAVIVVVAGIYLWNPAPDVSQKSQIESEVDQKVRDVTDPKAQARMRGTAEYQTAQVPKDIETITRTQPPIPVGYPIVVGFGFGILFTCAAQWAQRLFREAKSHRRLAEPPAPIQQHPPA
jgi:hypothetical protein